MAQEPDKHYGFVGWREILRVRKDILDKYDKAKKYNASRPVQTEHGSVGEAAVREWLSSFLPAKYGVTSGYIIPGIISEQYLLLHYDVIIYDRLGAPVLWIDDNPDQSEQGRKRAIPAQQVHAVFEVKSTLTRQNAIDAVKKLKELDAVRHELSGAVVSGIIFFELPSSLAEKRYVLKHLVPDTSVVGYYGGIVLRSSANVDMTGSFEFMQLGDDKTDTEIGDALVKDVDSVQVWRNAEGNITMGPRTSVFLYSNRGELHVSKSYIRSASKGECRIILQWSYNCFARFICELLWRLEGKNLHDLYNGGKGLFGQVFDRLNPGPE